MNRFAKILLLAGLCIIPAYSSAQAAGFYLQEASVKGLGAAFSGGATSLDDASTLWFNPAGMTDLDGAQVNLGAHILFPSAEVSDTGSTFGGSPVGGNDGGNPYSTTILPNFYAAAPIDDNAKWWAGIGVTTPFGLAGDYDDGWFGRFDSTKSELTTVDIQPSLAWRPADWIAIGGGINIQYVDAALESAVSNGVSTGVSKLEGRDWSLGYNAGIKITPRAGTDIGLHYRASVKHNLDGRIGASGLSSGNFDVSGKAELELPDIASIGIAQDMDDQWRVMAQATWFGWNHYDAIRPVRDDGVAVTPALQNYQTTWAYAVGAEYKPDDKWTLRAGYQYDETPSRNEYRSSRTPDGDRNWITAGASYTLDERWSVDFAAAYIIVSDETIDVSRNAGLARVRANTGGDIGIVAFGINYKF